MPGLSSWAVRRPVVALVTWFVAMIAIVAIGSAVKGTLNDSFTLPDTESSRAQELLNATEGAGSGFGSAATLVWSPTAGSAVDEATAAQMLPFLNTIAALPSVACVTNPFDPQGGSLGSDCRGDSAVTPEMMAALTPQEQATLASTFSTVSKDGRVAYASVSFAGDGADVSAADARAILDGVATLNGADLTVGVQGEVLEFAGMEPPSGELIGVGVAVVILLIAFGSLVAAGLPIVVALVGLGVGQMLVLVAARFLDVATFAPTLAAMIGLGVGIDYAVFITNRYRQALLAGHDAKSAALEAVNTSGRAVLFAGTTVIIALAGLWVLRMDFFNGLSVAAGVTVLAVMFSALWLLPALLSLLGNKALAIRMPWSRRIGDAHAEGRGWARYGRFLQRRAWLTGALATALVLVLAIPMFSMRQGFTDDSGKPAGSPARTAFDLRAAGFGPGSNGPFVVVADLSKATNPDAFGTIVAALNQVPGVAGTSPSLDVLPIMGKLAQAQAQGQAPSEGADPDQSQATTDGAGAGASAIQAIAVYPTTAPQDEATTDLLHRLRADVNPGLAAQTGATLYVGGTQAITTDFTDMLASVLPLFLVIVVGLGFIALMILFHSLLVPLTAAVTSLLSFAASLGITVAVFQWGWFNDLLGVTGTGPIMPFLPIMVFAILFGLSMDYQVFLVSRMHEEHVRTGDNAVSVRRGLAGSGRVVMIAAAIMTAVFAAFIPTNQAMIKLFGVALASAVVVDAFIVRLIIVPSAMSLFGNANWWLPRWLDRILPTVHIEPGEDEIVDDEPRDEPVSVR